MTTTTYKILSSLALLLLATLCNAQLVTTPAELSSAINAATPGTTIVLADGIWKDVFMDLDKSGTEDNPITVTAQNPGAVLMTGNSRVYMEGNHLILSGLVFQDPADLVGNSSEIEPVIELKRCNDCKVLNNKIDSYNGTESQKNIKFKWILADGLRNEIAYNSFVGKYGIGSIINDNRNSSGPDYLKIHHNYFADRTPINGINDDNDQDAIRIGNSSTSLSNSFTEVYENYFYNFFGEVEVISNKSCSNKYYNNTFRDYSGTLTLRHGNDCEVYGNYFFAEDNDFSGGVRVIGEGHQIYNNYIEGVNSRKPGGALSGATGGINVSNGRPNSALNGYYQVKNCQIVHNTFVDCDYALRVGTMVSSDLSLEPQNLTIANNITYDISDEDYEIQTEPSGNSKSEGNRIGLQSSAMTDDGNFHRLVAGSTPIDAAVGNYSYVSQDILGGNRDGNVDAGAEEHGAGGMRLPYMAEDVGVSVGFGGRAGPTLAVVPESMNFGIAGGMATFKVVSNVDWTISENIPWLELDITSGSGNETITATAIENNTGTERTGTIMINEVAGGGNLSASVIAMQLLTFIPEEIPIVGTTTLGMQDKDEVSEANAYDDNNGTYWTGDPDSEAEVSITFDLDCSHYLTEIGINFWKADERTTTFSIALAYDAAGPFRTVIENATSADSGVSVDTEQFFSLDGEIARYVKFIGIGNSSSTNWTSIANVNIYGDVNCTTDTATYDHPAESIALYPVPVVDGQLNIVSEKRILDDIDIHDVSGKLVYTGTGYHSQSIRLDLNHLGAGIYFIRVNGAGIKKFVVE